jgi:hypothetical protein
VEVALKEQTHEPAPCVSAAREKCHTLYKGEKTPHRSCGIAIAETFGLPTAPYQALRRGGLTGRGECGAVVGGRLVLGQLLGDPDPTGPATEALKEAITSFEAALPERLDRGDAPGDDLICNTLTAPFAEFRSDARHAFCTRIATEVAGLVAETTHAHDAMPPITPIADHDPAGLVKGNTP